MSSSKHDTPPSSKNSVSVLGAGSFGTCLAQHLATQGHRVQLWSHNNDIIKGIEKNQRNPKYLSSYKLSHRIHPTNHLDDLSSFNPHATILAIPTQAMRAVLIQVKDTWPHLSSLDLIVCASKGIEQSTFLLPHQIVGDVWGEDWLKRTALLSGPSFAIEVMQQQPTAVTTASSFDGPQKQTQDLFHADHFRTYTSSDPVGVALGGALKNIIAIAAGAAAGMGFEKNTQAALLTRGLAEIARIGQKMGADPLTFVGLSGVGDLFLTCTSEKSRNFSTGLYLGQGGAVETPHSKPSGTTAEGIATAKAAYEWARKYDVRTPIIDAVYQVLYEGKPISQAVIDVIAGDAKEEQEM